MALHFVLGGSNIDKSGWLCEAITREAGKNRDKHYLILVPEQFTMENQRKYVDKSSEKCIMNIDILSLLRLSVRVFEETGAIREVIDDLGKTLIVRKVMEENKDSLGFLKRGLTKIGVLDEIKSFLSELMQYDIGTVQLEDMLLSAKDANKPVLYDKLKDIKLIYEKFLEKTEDKYLTTEGMYDILENILEAAKSDKKQLKWLKNSRICLDGYTGFTPVQYKVIRQLLLMAEDVYLLIDIDSKGYENDEGTGMRGEGGLFSLPWETMHKMMELAKNEGVEIAPPVWPDKNRILSGELLHLEKTFLRYPAVRYEGSSSTEDIKVIRAVSPEQELRFTVSRIKELVISGEYRYGDIAVVTADMESYGVKLKEMLANEGIPSFLDKKRDIMGHSFTEYLRGFLKLYAGGFSDDDVTMFIKNAYYREVPEEGENVEDFGKGIDILENYIRKAGIKGFSQWKKPFYRKLKGISEERVELLDTLREGFLEKTAAYYEKMSRENTVLNFTECLYDFMTKEKTYLKLTVGKEKAEGEGDILRAREYEQIYGIVIGILDKMVEVLGDERVSLNEYIELFEVGLSGGKIGLIPPQMNVVLIGDLKRTRISDAGAMFILGVNDGVIPAPEDGGGILTEIEREFIHEEGDRGKKAYCLAPSKKYNALISRYYLYLNLTKPSKKLYLSYSEVNAKGEKKNPSYIIGKLRLIFPNLCEERWEDYKNTKSYDILPDRGKEFLLRGIRDKEMGADFNALFDWYGNKDGEWLNKIIWYAGETGLKGRIEKEAAKQLYGNEFYASVTRIENYARCALNHFLNYGLKLKEREIFKIQNPDFGSLFHEVMKEFFKNADPKKIFVENDALVLTPQQEEELVRALKKVVEGSGEMNEALWEKERSKYIFKRLERMCRRSIWAICIQMQKGSFSMKDFELPFGDKYSDKKSGWMEISDEVWMALRGVIDRLDIYETEDKLFYRIVDYKTGSHKVNLDEIYYGLQPQLFIYMEAARIYLGMLMKSQGKKKEIVPAGVYYYNVSDPVIDNFESPAEESLEGQLWGKILAELKMEGYTNSEDLIPEYTDRALREPSEEGKEEKSRNLSRGSDIVQLKYKKDGKFDTYSKVIDTKLFNKLKDHVIKKVKENAGRIYEGDTESAPTAISGEDACKYCPYGEICVLTKKDERQLLHLNDEKVFEEINKNSGRDNKEKDDEENKEKKEGEDRL